MSISAIADAVRNSRTSVFEVVDQTLKKIAVGNVELNAFTHVLGEQARAGARALDSSMANNTGAGALAGVPFAVKNLFDIQGIATCAGSKVLAEQEPARHDAAAVAALKAAGAILVGALNMDEFAFGFTTENSHYGVTRNPHNLDRVAGGSSGGSAAAVAAGLVPLTLGTDTNGSVRVPASFCGVFALKPTYGRISRRGVQLFCDSLDHVGLFARSSADLTLAYRQMLAHGAGDIGVDQTQKNKPLAGLRVARLGGYFEHWAGPQAQAAVATAAAVLDSGAVVDLPLADAARAAGAIITYAEAGNLHIERIRKRRRDFDPLVRHRLTAAALTPAQWYLQAQRIRTLWRRQLDDVFARYDVLLAPATPFAALPIGTESVILQGREMPARPTVGLLTQPLTPSGLPIAVAPLWPDTDTPSGLPVGVQIIAPAWREDIVLHIAALLEQSGVSEARLAEDWEKSC